MNFDMRDSDYISVLLENRRKSLKYIWRPGNSRGGRKVYIWSFLWSIVAIETVATWITHNSCDLSILNGTAFLILACLHWKQLMNVKGS